MLSCKSAKRSLEIFCIQDIFKNPILPFGKLFCGCLDGALFIVSHRVISHINNESGNSCCDTAAWDAQCVMNFLSTILISDPKLRQTKKTQTDWVRQWRRGHVLRKPLPSVSWPRQVDSSSSRSRHRSRVPIILGHLTQLCDSGPITCVLTIFTTTFQQATTCRNKKETAHKHRSVTSLHPWLCSIQHLQQRLSATSFPQWCATTEIHSRGHVECKVAELCTSPTEKHFEPMCLPYSQHTPLNPWSQRPYQSKTHFIFGLWLHYAAASWQCEMFDQWPLCLCIKGADCITGIAATKEDLENLKKLVL